MMTNLFDISQKRVVVVGACGLIGKEFCRSLALHGAHIAIADLASQNPKTFATSLQTRENQIVRAYNVNLASYQSIGSFVKAVLRDMKTIDVLINAAQSKPKGFLKSPSQDMPLRLWDQIIAVNLTSVFLTCQKFGREMVKRKKGSIINMASTYGIVSSNPWLYGNNSMGNPIAYSASKGGVLMLSKYLAIHWAKKGVRVNCLTPHGVYNKHEEQFVKRFCHLSPMGRMMERTELLGALLFLVSDASSYVTGANIVVDGGWTAW